MGSSFHDRWEEQKRTLFNKYDAESIASKLVISFFVTDVILGTIIYFVGGLSINRKLLHMYYCYSLSGSVLTILLSAAAMGLSAKGWFTFNTSILNIAIGILTILGCFVTIAVQIYFIFIIRRDSANLYKTKCMMNERSEIEYPVQIDEETVEREKVKN